MSTEPVFDPSKPLVYEDGTPQYAFRDFLTRTDVTIRQAAKTGEWGSVTGTLSDQTDLVSGGKILDSLLSPVPPTVRGEANDPYTLVISDANTVVRFTTAGADVTIPDEASVNFDVGTEVSIRQAGTGTLSLTTTGLTINGTIPPWSQHVEVKLRKVGTDEWDVV